MVAANRPAAVVRGRELAPRLRVPRLTTGRALALLANSSLASARRCRRVFGAPGYRHPFHCHRVNYCWVCTVPGRSIQRLTDGTMTLSKFSLGEVDFLEASPQSPLIHDLENVCDAPLRFTTIELLNGHRPAITGA